jgi:phosphoglycolate phosphatase-like HAD superfamily hydrolase
MAGHDQRPAVRAVIFDLDGTLVQTRVASWEVFARISRRFELGVTRQEQYFHLFRGNVFASIRELCRDDAHAAEVKTAFIDLLRSDYTPPMVPGMVNVVRQLAGNCTLAVMSSNVMQVLRRVLVANDLAFCFAHVFGGDVAPDKRDAIRAFLSDSGTAFGRHCVADYDEGGRGTVPNPATTVLVTDTAGDVRDALAAGIRWTSSLRPGRSSSRCGRRRCRPTYSTTRRPPPRAEHALSRRPSRRPPPVAAGAVARMVQPWPCRARSAGTAGEPGHWLWPCRCRTASSRRTHPVPQPVRLPQPNCSRRSGECAADAESGVP